MSARDLAGVGAAEKKVLTFVRERCAREPGIRRAVLFGSRARGGHHERSDFDVAVDAPGLADEAWARFVLELKGACSHLMRRRLGPMGR